MKAKKHTKALLLALSVVSMLVSGLFVVNANQAGAVYPECPEGFVATDDGKSCWSLPARVTITPPAYCKEGTMTPDGRSCITPVSYNHNDPTSKDVVIDAKVTTGDDSYRCPAGWTGPTKKADGTYVCTQETATPSLTQPATEIKGTTTYSCTRGGTLSGTTCTIAGTTTPGVYVPAKAAVPAGCSNTPGYTYFPADANGNAAKCFASPTNFSTCPAGGSADPATKHDDGRIKGCLAPITPAVAATSATCNGVATTGTAADCVTTTAATTYPATPSTPASSWTCPAGWSGPDASHMCTKAQPNGTNEIAATKIPGGSSATCPDGYTGPTSDLKCTRKELTAQPDTPTCKKGTLLKTGKNSYVCLLDNKPVTDEPVVGAECVLGVYDAKQDRCFVSATAGQHGGSVTVVSKTEATVVTKPVKIGFTG